MSTITAAENLLRQMETLVADASFKQILGVVNENSELRVKNKILETTNQRNIESLTQIQQQVSALATLQKDHATLRVSLSDAERKLKEKQKALENAAAEATQLRQTIKSKDADIGSLEDRLKKEKDAAAAASRSQQHIQKELALAQKTLNGHAEKLKRLDALASQMGSTPREKICQHLHGIFKSAQTLVESYFGSDFDKSTLDEVASWDKMRSHSLVKRSIPLPCSNTLAAKQMRVAAVLAIIGESLAEYVFQPTYLLKESNELSGLLADLGDVDPEREAYLRAVLLPVMPDMQRENGKARYRHVVIHVFSYVGTILPSEKRDAFRSALEKCCEKSCADWMQLQSSHERIEPMFEPFDVEEWVLAPFSLQEDGLKGNKSNTVNSRVSSSNVSKPTATRKITGVAPRDVQAVIWPAFLMGKEGESELLEKGFVLTEAKTKAARDEEAAAQPTRRAARQTARKGRAQSFAKNGDEVGPEKSGFLSQKDGGGSKGCA